jgi:hypothetical protein
MAMRGTRMPTFFEETVRSLSYSIILSTLRLGVARRMGWSLSGK